MPRNFNQGQNNFHFFFSRVIWNPFRKKSKMTNNELPSLMLINVILSIMKRYFFTTLSLAAITLSTNCKSKTTTTDQRQHGASAKKPTYVFGAKQLHQYHHDQSRLDKPKLMKRKPMPTAVGKRLLPRPAPASAPMIFPSTTAKGADSQCTDREVWFCSGPSNGNTDCRIRDIRSELQYHYRQLNHAAIHAGWIEKIGSHTAEYATAKWKMSSRRTSGIQCTAYNYAKNHSSARCKCPIIINCSWGGSRVGKAGCCEGDPTDLQTKIWAKPAAAKGHQYICSRWLCTTACCIPASIIRSRFRMVSGLQQWILQNLRWPTGHDGQTLAFALGTRRHSFLLRWDRALQLRRSGKNERCHAERTTVQGFGFDSKQRHDLDKRSRAAVKWIRFIPATKDVGERLAYQSPQQDLRFYVDQNRRSDVPGDEGRRQPKPAITFTNADEGFSPWDGITGFEVAGADKVFKAAKR